MKISSLAFLVLPLALGVLTGAPLMGAEAPLRGSNASDAQVQGGLRQALALSTNEAIRKAGVENGFWRNDAIKIGLPSKMATAEKALRQSGQGLRIGDLEQTMNRIAETVAPVSASFFTKLIAEQTFSDGRAVLNGSGNAVTESFRQAAYPALVRALLPTVTAVTARTSAQQQLNTLAIQYTSVSMGEKCETKLEEYITEKMLDGIFTLAGQEEANIRSSPQSQIEPIKTAFSLPY